MYTEWSKSLCAPDDYSTKNTQKYNRLTVDDLEMAITKYIRNVVRAIYTEHSLREHSSACQ
jgi:hypothetical protein